MNNLQTLTIDELIAYLTNFPHDTKVFISSDSEGNGFGTLSTAGTCTEYHENDKSIVLFPARERLDFDEIFPNEWDRLSAE